MAQTKETETEYPMFKGLQRPLEFMGLQGRYITWAAITAAVGILGFMIVYAVAGFIVKSKGRFFWFVVCFAV